MILKRVSRVDWKAFWSSYATATRLYDESAKVQVCMLLTIINSEVHAIFRTFVWEDADDKADLNKVLEAFDNYFEPRRNTAHEQYRFPIWNLGDGEPFEQYDVCMRAAHSVPSLKTKFCLIHWFSLLTLILLAETGKHSLCV